ncbi:anti-sigma factor RsbA family regulatory protein [Geodermatophilus sp. SYSU D00710]
MPRGAPARRPSPPVAPGGLLHTAALVHSAVEAVEVATAFLEEGLRAGDLPVLACSPDTAGAVRRALGVVVGAVEEDPRICMLGVRAPDAMAAARRLVERAAGSRSGRLRVVTEPQYEADPRRWREVRRYEAAANALAATLPLTLLCLYDRQRLPAQALETARLTHPELFMGGVRVTSSDYRRPGSCLRDLAVVREPVEAGEPVYAVDAVPTLPRLRADLRQVLAAVVPDADQRADLHLAASEVAANAFRHGRPPVSARVWADDTAVVCTITDSGPGVADPLAGFLPAHGDDLAAGGMGLWLARKLWDSVDLLPGTTGGFTVRLATTLHDTRAGRGAA